MRGARLEGDGKLRPLPSDAYRLARRKFLRGERIDMGQLAAELGINRVTLYRWVGTVDSLLVEVIWSLTETTLSKEWETLQDVEGSRVPALLGGFLRATMEQPGGRRWSLAENERAMRLMTLAKYGYQPRLVAIVGDYLAEDIAEGRLHSSLALDELAYACVRVTESYYYLPTIVGQPPDPDGAQRVLAALLS